MAVELKVGDAAPAFSLQSTSGETISLADFLGKRDVVLYFYPKDDTSGCTVEACSFNESLPELGDRNVAVLGVSPDSVASHAKFTKKYDLRFPLLADTEKSVAEAYGVWVEKSMYGRKYMGVERSTFLIGTDGTIKNIWRKVTPKTHVADVIGAVR
jgi:peroxiredoxin Q/BCP